MNIERLIEIAEWLEAGAPHKGNVHGFSMESFERYDPKCGTVCCIAGAANQFFGARLANDPCTGREDLSAADLLGLDGEDRYVLFFPPEGWSQITPAHAARVIRKLIATGEVDWKSTKDPA